VGAPLFHEIESQDVVNSNTMRIKLADIILTSQIFGIVKSVRIVQGSGGREGGGGASGGRSKGKRKYSAGMLERNVFTHFSFTYVYTSKHHHPLLPQ
jgi:hypothetical protein